MNSKFTEMSVAFGSLTAMRGRTLFLHVARLFRDPLVALVFGLAVLCALVLPQHFFGLLSFYSNLLPPAVLLILLILLAQAIMTSPASPLTAFVAIARRTQIRIWMTLPLVVIFLACFTTLKVNIPAVVPFFADPAIAAVDAWLHGTDAWRLTRFLPPEASLVIDFFYSQIWFIVAFATLLFAALGHSTPEFRRFAWATVLIYILLGFVAATMMSSVGPVFYDRFYPQARFHDLVTLIEADPYAIGQKIYMHYLYDTYRSQTVAIGTGISAMPSIHVGVAVLTAWFLTSRSMAWTISGWAFAAITLFASVYTGWHYAVDGYVSALAATVIWFALSRHYKLAIFGARRRMAVAADSL